MSQFIVSARKYRPVRFEDVLGQEHISHTLKMAISQNKLAHAFLFTGPRGVGKTTCARILAKTINCLEPSNDFEPCGHCESCKSFDESASFSIFEMDAASNNSVDHIRNLIDQVRIPPLVGKYKIFIIDEVHMLSTAAFNSFLKTLEEPPSYAIFILATTEKHKILPTILSRCQIFDFRRLQIKDIVKQLNIIAKEENIQTEPEALHQIATKADGAMRDALSIFDRISGANDSNITLEAVLENLNILDYSYFFKVFDSLLLEDLSGVMLNLDEVIRKGFDTEVFLTGLAEHIRQLLVSRDPDTIKLIENTEAVREKFKDQAQLAPLSFLVTCLDLCNACDIQMKTARNKRLHLEMTLIKMVYIRRALMTDTFNLTSDQKKNPYSVELTLSSTNSNNHQGHVSDVAVDPSRLSEPVSDTSNVTEQHIQSEQEKLKDTTPIISTGKEPAATDTIKPHAQEAQKPALSFNKTISGKDKLKKFESIAHQTLNSESQHNQSFSIETTQQLWREYAPKASDTIRLIMESRQPEHIEDDCIYLTVSSPFERESLINEFTLVEFLRHNLKNKRIRLECNIDASLIKDIETLKPMTPQEKLLKMNEINPVLQLLYDQLNLRIDE